MDRHISASLIFEKANRASIRPMPILSAPRTFCPSYWRDGMNMAEARPTEEAGTVMLMYGGHVLSGRKQISPPY